MHKYEYCSIKRAESGEDSLKGHRRWDQIYTKRNNRGSFRKNPWCYGIYFPLRSGQKRIVRACVQNVGDTLNRFCKVFKPISREDNGWFNNVCMITCGSHNKNRDTLWHRSSFRTRLMQVDPGTCTWMCLKSIKRKPLSVPDEQHSLVVRHPSICHTGDMIQYRRGEGWWWWRPRSVTPIREEKRCASRRVHVQSGLNCESKRELIH